MEKPPIRNVELADRKIGGLIIKLFWREGTMPPESFVTVEDEKLGEAFTATVPAGISPNEVFMHPFIYRDEEKPLYLPSDLENAA